MNVDEFWAKYADDAYELLHGQLISTKEKDDLALEVLQLVAGELAEVVDNGETEDILAGSVGCALTQDTMLAPDITFLTAAQLARISDPEAYIPFAPDFVVEVHHADEGVAERVRLYLENGTRLVWILDPVLERLTAYMPQGKAETYAPGMTISAAPCINHRFPVRAFFPEEA